MTTPRARRRSRASARRFLVDTSVWQRLSLRPVRAAMESIHGQYTPWSILTCPPIAAEVGFSARSPADHRTVRQSLGAFTECSKHPPTTLVQDIQYALWAGGLVRAVGAMDTLIAAYAIANDAIVLHYDRDFEFVARVRTDFQQVWVAPRGSL